MIGDLGAPELLIIFALVALLFGVGKVGKLGKELGTSVKEFRRAVRDEEESPPQEAQPYVAAPQGQQYVVEGQYTVAPQAQPQYAQPAAAAAAPAPVQPQGDKAPSIF